MKTFCIAVLLVFSTATYHAQTTSALSGVVTDPSGALIPGVDIVLVNPETNAQRKVRSDEAGRYSFPLMQPGSYDLTASAAGFSEVVIRSIRLLVNTASVVDVKLAVGTVQQSIAVVADAPQVNTLDATIGNAVGERPILELPFEARNVVGLLSIQPGVTFFGDPSQRDDYRSGSVNGSKSDQGNVTLDGVDVNDQQNRTAFTSVLRTTLDSVQEFRTTTTNGGADVGRTSGAQVALVTKSGTNVVHGSLYEYHRNTITSANSFFNNASGVPRPKLIRNVFGGSVGGPIVKDRLFYFLNYEGRRDASEGSVVRVVPNMLFRQGIFTYRTTDGVTRQLTPAQVLDLDPAHIGESAAVLKTLQGYPTPNDTTVGDGLNTAGFRFKSSVPLTYNTYISRLDYQVDTAGKHSVFWRGNLQNDHFVSGLPQFPGQPDSVVRIENSKGLAAGHTWVVSPSLVSTLRYGFTRQSYDTTGLQTGPIVSLSGIADPIATTKALRANIPVHNIEENLSWMRRSHSVSFGGSVRIIRTNRLSFGNSFSSASANYSWFLDNARFTLLPNVDSRTTSVYTQQMVNLLGMVSQGNANYNYDKSGNLVPQGQGISRSFVDNEYEFYVQDSWKVTRSLTLTGGARVSVFPPLHEVNGYQTSSNIPLSEWMAQRAALAAQGKPQSMVEPLSFQLSSGPGGRPLYPSQRHVAPRIALAYSPQSSSGWAARLFGGPGKTSIRGGAGLYYDLFGQSLIRLADATALGFSTAIRNPGTQTASTVYRYISLTDIPAGILPAAPKGGFPQVAPSVFASTTGLDDRLKGPYSISMNFDVGRDFDHGFHFEASYIGRLSRRSLIGDDVSMYTNLVDPKSQQSYFDAATALELQVRAKTPVANVPAIPFFENIFPGYAGSGRTATQNIYQNFWLLNPSSETTALQAIDASASNCSPCSVFGPNALYNPQYVSLKAYRSIGRGDYHAAQLTLRKRFSDGVQFDLNYTFAKSIDLGSTRESDGASNKAVLNPWSSGQMRAVSDYDVRHVVSAFFVAELPFGQGRPLVSSSNKVVNALVGGWQLSGVWRQSSGLPVGVANGSFWPTNWSAAGWATPVGPFTQGTTKNAPTRGPNIFPDPQTAFSAFALTLPGQSGTRNVVRGDGYFTIDTGLSKRFGMPYNEHHFVQFRAEAFNLTNTVRFDVNQLSLSLGNSATFGKYSGTLNTPRVIQFGMRYEF